MPILKFDEIIDYEFASFEMVARVFVKKSDISQTFTRTYKKR